VKSPLIAVGVVLALSGCTLLPVIGPSGASAPVASDVPVIGGAVKVGDCLSDALGPDSDRDSVVSCDEPHFYDVLSLEEWPGMQAALDDAAADEVFTALHRYDDAGISGGYDTWASQTCDDTMRAELGWDALGFDGHTADELYLKPGGSFTSDFSLASRAAFVGGDHRTLCSVGWYDDRGNLAISYPDGLRFADVLQRGFPLEARECWDVDTYTVPCSDDHAYQNLVNFEGLEIFGADLISRFGDGTATDSDWAVADDFCQTVLNDALPLSASLDGLGYLANFGASSGWDSFEGTVDPDEYYAFVCLASPLQPGDLLSGDVFNADAAIVSGPGQGEGA
jgi:hypothetical protein